MASLTPFIIIITLPLLLFSLISATGAQGIDGSFSASGTLNFSWLGAALGSGPTTLVPPPPTTPPPPPPPTTPVPMPLGIPQQYDGSPCICKMMAELVGKMNLLVDGQIAAINGTADPYAAVNSASLLFASPVVVANTTIVVKELPADPTLLEQLSAKIKMYIPPELKQILLSIRISELQGLIVLLKMGSVKTLKDLIAAIQEKMPALYAVLKALYMKLIVKIDDLKAMLGDPAINFLKQIGQLFVDDAKDIYKFITDNMKSYPSLGPNMLSAFLSLFGNISLTVNGKTIQTTGVVVDPAAAAVSVPPPPPVPAVSPPPPMNCPKPMNTAMLIYNKSDPKIKTQVTPAAECQCPNDPTSTMVFFNPVAQTPTTGVNAGASPINQQCSKTEDFCICDESDVCWKLTNAIAQVVINSFCDPDCHMYARLNNIAPYTQTLVADNGKTIKLSDELYTLPNGKNHAYKPMQSSADYYVKAKSISCTGVGKKCAPIKCAPNPSPAPVPSPPPLSSPSPAVTTTITTVIDVQISITIDASFMAFLNVLGIGQVPPNLGITQLPPLIVSASADPSVQMALPPLNITIPSSSPLPPTVLMPQILPTVSPLPPALISGDPSLTASGSIFVSISLIIQDIAAQINVNLDDPINKILKPSLDVNVDANLNELAKKVEGLMPQCPLELLSKVKPSDVQGIQVLIDIVIKGQMDLSKPADLADQLKLKAPGINDSVLGLLASTSNYLKQFGDPATQKLGQQIYQLNASLRVSLKAQCDANAAGMQKIKDLVLQYCPDAAPVLDGKVDPVGAVIKMLQNGMKELSDKVKYQQALDGMKVDPNNLGDLAMTIKGMLSVDIRATFALIQPKDIDGIQIVLKMSANGQIECIHDLIAAMAANCPGLMDALLMLIRKLIVWANAIYQKLDDAAKDLIKKFLQAIVDFFKNDVQKAVQVIQQAAPGMLTKMLNDLMNAVPSLKPLINGLKFSLNVDISVKMDNNGIVANAQVNGSVASNAVCPATGGTWSEWQTTGQCTDTCGLCGTQKQERKCTTEASGCPCSGPSTQDIGCNPNPCTFPKPSCCSGKSAKTNKVTKQIECMP